MDLYYEILAKIISEELARVKFPDFSSAINMRCYEALKKIKAIIEDESLADAECFLRVEEIVRVFEELGSGGGFRHDF